MSIKNDIHTWLSTQVYMQATTTHVCYFNKNTGIFIALSQEHRSLTVTPADPVLKDHFFSWSIFPQAHASTWLLFSETTAILMATVYLLLFGQSQQYFVKEKKNKPPPHPDPHPDF